MEADKAPGRSEREGITLIQLFEIFHGNETAEKWIEAQVWPEQQCCGHCGSTNTKEVKNRKRIPCWRGDCRSYFSVRAGTVFQSTRIPCASGQSLSTSTAQASRAYPA